MPSRLRICCICLSVALAAACGEGPPARSEVLKDLVDDAIVPAYAELASSTKDLAAATIGLCETRTSSDLAIAREALANARADWSYIEPWWAGPVMERRSWVYIDWPIAVDEIEALVADTSVELDFDRLAYRIGADQRGLGAVEHIFGEADDGVAVLEALADSRRCQYLTGIADLIADEAALLYDDWTADFEETGPYSVILADTNGDGLDSLVNDALFLIRAMVDRELGVALGEMGREPDVEAIVEGPANLAVVDILRHLDGLEMSLIGNSVTPGLGPLLGDDLIIRLRGDFEEARRATNMIDLPLRAAVIEQPEVVSKAREAIVALRVTVATEVVSRLGVTVGFSDADGDTGS